MKKKGTIKAPIDNQGDLNLSYDVTTEPSPLQLSSVGNIVTGKIIITVTNTTNFVCEWIEFDVPKGDQATALYLDNSALIGQPAPGWGYDESILPITSGGEGDQQFFQAKFTNRYTDGSMADSFTFTLIGDVNMVSGTAKILIRENSAPASDDISEATIQCGSFNETKSSTPAFFLYDLVTSLVGGPTLPCSEFALTDTVELTWKSNGTDFYVYSSNQKEPYHTTSQSLTFQAVATTTLVVVAIYEDQPLMEAITYTVRNPNLQVNSLEVQNSTVQQDYTFTNNQSAPFLNGLAVTGETIIKENAAFSQIENAGPITVHGDTQLNDTVAKNVTVTGSATFSQQLTADTIQLNNTVITSNLNPDVTMNLNNVNIQGNLAATGSIVSLLGAPQLIYKVPTIKSFKAQALTDGFVSMVMQPNRSQTPSYVGSGMMQVADQKNFFWVYYGGIFSQNSKLASLSYLTNCVPVSKGTTFSALVMTASSMPVSFFWHPMGVSDQATGFKILSSSNDLSSVPAELTEHMKSMQQQKELAMDFLDCLEKGLDAPMEKHLKEELSEMMVAR